MTIRIRDFKDSDFSQLAALLGRTWHTSQGEGAFWCGANELAWHLTRAQHSVIAHEDDAILGAVLCEMAGSPINERWAAEQWQIAQIAWTQDGIDSRAHEEFELDEDALMAEVNEQLGTDAVGVIDLLVVTQDARGQGLGRRLLDAALRWLEGEGADYVRLVTDDGCDWGLYEHLGMERVASRPSGTGKQANVYCYQGAIEQLLR